MKDYCSTSSQTSQKDLLPSAVKVLKRGVIEHIGDGEDREDSLRELCNYVQDKIKLLPIEVSREGEAYLVFDTTNTRGRHLDLSDRFKARLATIAERADGLLSEELIKQWNNVAGKLEAKLGIDAMDDYLPVIWTSKRGYATKRTLDRIAFGPLTNTNELEEFVNDLRVYCDSYLAVVTPEGEDGIDLDLKDLKDLKVQQAISFLTMVRKHSPDRFEEAVSLVLSFQVRNITISGQGPNVYQEQWPEWAKCARQRDPEKAFGEIRGHMVDDKSFRKAFEQKTVAPRTARPLLRKLDGNIRPTAGAKHSSVHIEHILPKSVVNTLLKERARTRNNVKRWIEDIGKPFPTATEEKRRLGKSLETFLNMLGNQALLYHKANGIATDAPFRDKREFYKGQASELTKTLAENAMWGPKEIIARQKMLAERAPEVWRA